MRTFSLSIYGALTIFGFGTWLASKFLPAKFAPLNELFGRAFESRSNRIAILIIWWWFGWHFLGTPWPE
ncbi:MAG: DUF6186 family protein [Actinomycetota bacterium]